VPNMEVLTYSSASRLPMGKTALPGRRPPAGRHAAETILVVDNEASPPAGQTVYD
jgi:hypothetical protein